MLDNANGNCGNLPYHPNNEDDTTDTTPLVQKTRLQPSHQKTRLQLSHQKTRLQPSNYTPNSSLDFHFVSEAEHAIDEPDTEEQDNNSSTLKITSEPSLYQVVIIVVGSLYYFGTGMGTAWPNSFALDIATDNTTLFHTQLHPLESQMDLIASISLLGSLTGMMPGGWLIGRMGGRRVLFISAFGLTFSWVLTALSGNMEMIFVSRYLMGAMAAVGGTAVRTFTIEVSSNNIRGRMLSVIEICRVVGFISSPSLSLVTTWYHIAFINALLMLIFGTIITVFFPETPNYFIIHGQDSKARSVLKRLRSQNSNVEEELRQIKLMNQQTNRRNKWTALFTKEYMKPFLTIVGLYTVITFTGIYVLIVNLTRLLQRFSLPFDTGVSTVLVSMATLGGSIAVTVLIDRIGRRWCLKISMAICIVSYTVLGIIAYQDTSQDAPQQPQALLNDDTLPDHLHYVIKRDMWSAQTWVTLVCFLTTAFAANFGMNIPTVLCLEYFPTRVRSQAYSACVTVYIVIIFLAMQLYTPMMDTLGLAGLLWFYATVSGLCIIYITMFVWETSHKSIV